MLNTKRFIFLALITILFSCGQPPEQQNANAPTSDTATPPQPSEQVSGVLAASWVEGVHYTVISDEATEEAEVVEYFSFWCPACFNFEPIIDLIKQSIGDSVEFKKVHVYFMNFTTPEIQNEVSQAMLIAKSLGESDKYIAAIFDHIHKQRKSMDGLSDARSLFIANGMSEDAFDNAAQSDEVAELLKQNNDAINQYREHLTSVPTIIVNGKYKPIFQQGMTFNDIIELVNWLSTQK